MRTFEEAIQWLVDNDENGWVSTFDEDGVANESALIVAFIYGLDILDVHAALLVALQHLGRL